MSAGRSLKRLKVAALAAGAAQFVPSTVILGQWGLWRSLPGDLCRWQGPPQAKVALTFDDGPHPEGTPAILDKLDELDLRATFFLVGECAQRWPDLARMVATRGHQVATHGYSHCHHLARSPLWVARDLSAGQRVMGEIGLPVSWYRPSYGQVSGATLIAARALGLRTVLWSAWGREWTTRDPGQVSARIVRRLGEGSIVLLHDSDRFGPAGMWRTGLAALEEVASCLKNRGLQAVTLDDLIGSAGKEQDSSRSRGRLRTQ
ncbi:MAG: polysaccharide deacetylase family protein [Actinobacteria bacterium]|nr:polysaccharide deacetylase family protein [Actinomycetota bacterium]